MNNNFQLVQRKNNTNLFVKYLSMGSSLLLGAIFATLLGFISYMAVKGFNEYGFDILFSAKAEDNSFWIPFSVTVLTSLIAIIVSVPIGIKVAIFTKYRLHKRWRNKIIILFQTLSGIPSVIFGLFAVNSLGLLFNSLFGFSSNSIFNASIMLAFMIIPTIIAMTLDSLNAIDVNILSNSLALGNSKTRSIYKVCKKAARSGIIVAIVVAISRAIGESMAVSMILQSQPNNELFQNGFFEVLNSSSQSLGAYISATMFADSDPEKIRPLLYAFGLIMLFFSMFLNTIIFIISNSKKTSTNAIIIKIRNGILNIVTFIPRNIKIFFEGLSFKSEHKISHEDLSVTMNYIKDRNENYKYGNLYHYYKIIFESICIVICFTFLVWIVGDILINGLIATSKSSSSIWEYSKNTVGQSFLNTLLLILVCLVVSFPIALFIAIYLNEYARKGPFKKMIVFLLDSLSSTPSILFGMFGLLFFIQTFGLTNTGTTGNSLIAGVLTVVIVVIPTFIRLLEQSLINIPDEIRMNSYSLGNTKSETIKKLIIPMALIAITGNIVSIIGRILSETAPLYLTAGLSSSSDIALNRPGTTLTTHIYAQLFSNSDDSKWIQYEAALIAILLVFSLVFIVYVILPNRHKIKHFFQRLKNHLKNDLSVDSSAEEKNKKEVVQ
ncbi:MAG: phosphate ABC transporter permease PstA [Metamycoplasmataceae bacterium]